MSKISEQKALEAYPDKYIHLPFGINIADINDFKREGYAKGYNQAYQDFLEKAMKYLAKNLLVSDLEHKEYLCMTEENKDNFIQDFKNYMQNEM